MSQFFRSAGCCSSNSGDHALDSEEYLPKRRSSQSWKIPKVPTTKIYRSRKPFSIFSDGSIRTEEGEVSFDSDGGSAKLISINLYTFLRERKAYTRINVGMVQIGVTTTLTRNIPSNASIILFVCDNRLEKFEDSILGVVESRLTDCPFYFNIFPNITVPIKFGPTSFGALALYVMIEGLERVPAPAGSEPVVVEYRSCFKLQKDSGQTALMESPVGRTVWFQADCENPEGRVQKVSIWEDVVCKLDSTLKERAKKEMDISAIRSISI